MWRWPLNTTRLVCCWLAVIAYGFGGPLGWVFRLAWRIATTLALIAAVAQAIALMALITAPLALVGFVVDSVTVLRGGLPPARTGAGRRATRNLAAAELAAADRATSIQAQVLARTQGATPT